MSNSGLLGYTLPGTNKYKIGILLDQARHNVSRKIGNTFSPKIKNTRKKRYNSSGVKLPIIQEHSRTIIPSNFINYDIKWENCPSSEEYNNMSNSDRDSYHLFSKFINYPQEFQNLEGKDINIVLKEPLKRWNASLTLKTRGIEHPRQKKYSAKGGKYRNKTKGKPIYPIKKCKYKIKCK